MIDYATPARHDATHAHVCPACRQPWSCPDPECARPAETTCPGCSAEEWGKVQERAFSLARSGWAALHDADEARREGGDHA
jgi:hypothetical protein